jgi:hypothetical protein
MATRSDERLGLVGAVRRVAEHAAAIVRLEATLAVSEIRRKTAALFVGIGLLAVSGLFGALALTLLVATGIAALSLVLPVWLSLLVSAAGVLVIAAIVAVGAISLVKRGVPPIPEQAIEEARLTAEALRNGLG